MLFNKNAVLSLASALVALPAVLAAAVLQDTSGKPNGGHVDYVFDIANANVEPVSTFPLLSSSSQFQMASRMDTLAPLFLSTGESPYTYISLRDPNLTSSDPVSSQFHGPTIYATKGDRLNVCYITQHLV